ncbi:unnamed protein product, partial [Laminaria digitata]
GIDTAAFSVSSMFHTNYKALDIFADKVTSDARRRCQPSDDDGEDAQLLYDLHLRVAIVYTVVYGGIVTMPYCTPQLEAIMAKRGHPLSLIMQEETSVDTPWGLAKAYVTETMAYMLENDGWNADGSQSREFNRIPFSDYEAKDSAGNTWTPYQPQNSPYKLTKRRRWQPLIESNGLGYLTTQEHVTPHIGVTARFFGFNSEGDEEAFASRQLSQPEYRSRYKEVAQEALAESTITADNMFKQHAIAFFDNKFGSLVPLKALFFIQNSDTFSNLEFYRVTVAVQLAIYNGVVLAWREKIRHDLPRPPTIVRDTFGNSLVEAYAGPGAGVQTMKASEWEPFIRTMPHSEFPSASACLCKVFAEQVVNFVGVDDINPPLDLADFSFSSWSEISEVCGDSRVWGGMHFEGAVPAGVELCGGGDMAASIYNSLARLVEGDEHAAIFNRDVGELMLRPL